jgi:hypothetical protein
MNKFFNEGARKESKASRKMVSQIDCVQLCDKT